MSLISVIITTQSRRDALEKCLDALYASDDLSGVGEIIIVDDCSNDTTRDFLAESLQNGRVSKAVFNERIVGPAAARNRGVQVAECEHSLIMGDDVLFFPDAISRFVEFIKAEGLANASLLGNIMPYPDGMTAFEWWSCNGGSQFGHSRLPEGKTRDIGEEFFYTSNIVTPTALLREFPFDESFPHARYEDRELAYRLKRAVGHKIHYLPEAKSYHYHKLQFKDWLIKFKRFTWAAVHFTELHPEDETLRSQVGIERAIDSKSFDFPSLKAAVEVVNREHASFFEMCSSFGEQWRKSYLLEGFRYLQEFFRVNYLREHLRLPEIVERSSQSPASEAMEYILTNLEERA